MGYRIVKDIINLNNLILPVQTKPKYNPKTLDKIEKSIKANGWIPNFGHLSYHADTARYGMPFAILRNKKTNKDHAINCLHRIKVLQNLGYKEIEGYIKNFNYKSKYNKKYIEDKVINIRQELKHNMKGMFQSFEFDFEIKLNSRDDSNGIFRSIEWDFPYWIDKNVLDIACNGGYFAFEAKRNGANIVVGFDHDSYMIDKSKQFKDLLDFDVDLSAQNFWDFDWNQKFDIVFCNQCIYHFGNNSKALEALDIVCNATTNNLVMFTFVHFNDPYKSDFYNGYRPGYERLWDDLKKRGFKEILIYHHEGSKRTVVASKQPWKYLYNSNRSKHLKYYNSTLDSKLEIRVRNWHTVPEEELKDCWK